MKNTCSRKLGGLLLAAAVSCVPTAALYAQARAELLHALTLDPDDQLRGDTEDILDVIARATGEPWDEEWRTRAAPRPR